MPNGPLAIILNLNCHGLWKKRKKTKNEPVLVASLFVCVYFCIYSWLTIVQPMMCTGNQFDCSAGDRTQMPADQIYLVVPLFLCSVMLLFTCTALGAAGPPADQISGWRS
jgi:hypothetical protein